MLSVSGVSRDEAVGSLPNFLERDLPGRVDQRTSAGRAFPSVMKVRPVAVAGAPPRAEVVSEHMARFRIDLLDAVLANRKKSRQAPMSLVTMPVIHSREASSGRPDGSPKRRTV